MSRGRLRSTRQRRNDLWAENESLLTSFVLQTARSDPTGVMNNDA